jgi:hypothetical protein
LKQHALLRAGDRVKPKPEWRDDPNQIPTGIIVEIAPWGTCGAIYVEGERRAFAAYVFERDDQRMRR